MAGSRRRSKVAWLADGPLSFAHAFRKRNEDLAERSECGVPRVGGMRRRRDKCPACLYALARDMR